MAALNLITLATVKTQLGITNVASDVAITNMIPIVSSDIRRILNMQYGEYLSCTVTVGSNQVLISDIISVYNNPATLAVGTVIQSTAFAPDTYITNYDPTTGYYTASSVAIADATILYPTVDISQWMSISKMIWYKVSKQTTVGVAKERGISSESYGPISLSYSNKDTNNKWNYPSSLISDLSTPYASVG